MDNACSPMRGRLRFANPSAYETVTVASYILKDEAEARQIRRGQSRPIAADIRRIVPAIVGKRREAGERNVSLLWMIGVERHKPALVVH
jgi:hypothetical protein